MQKPGALEIQSSEYSIHMYGWAVFGRYYRQDDMLGELAKQSRQADIEDKMDSRLRIKIPTILYGLFGGF